MHAKDPKAAHQALESWSVMNTDSENEDDSQEGDADQAPSDEESEEY